MDDVTAGQAERDNPKRMETRMYATYVEHRSISSGAMAPEHK